jgi:LEA14-like dessication related protein
MITGESMRKGILFLSFVLAVWGAVDARSAKRDLKIEVQEKRIQNLSPQSVTLSFVLQVANSSSEPWFLTSYDYRILVANAEFFRLQRTLDTALTVRPAGQTLISLPVKITYDYLFQSFPAGRERDKLECTLVGGLFFAERAGERGTRINVAMTGDFPVYKGLRAVILPLEIRALSVGGADLIYRAEIRNLNAFPLQVRGLSYRLEVGGKQVAGGKAAGDGRLNPQTSWPFELPLLLEFFEVGPELYPLLQKPEVECRFVGEVLISIPWGEFSVPFDQAERVPVRKAEPADSSPQGRRRSKS